MLLLAGRQICSHGHAGSYSPPTLVFHDPRDLLRRIPEDARVLDVGGADDVFPRADAVIDARPYDSRRRGSPPPPSLRQRLRGSSGADRQVLDLPERFTAETWYVGDVCDAATWTALADQSFDFVVCSHVLEDVRDPVFVCRQLVRVGRAGYIETPSRFRECAKARADDEDAGWNHHRWIVDVEADRLVFTAKLGWASHFDYLGEGRRRLLSNRFNNYLGLLWEESFDFLERAPKGPVNEAENLFLYFDEFVDRTAAPVTLVRGVAHRGKTFEGPAEFLLPIERRSHPLEILSRWQRRRRGERVAPL